MGIVDWFQKILPTMWNMFFDVTFVMSQGIIDNHDAIILS